MMKKNDGSRVNVRGLRTVPYILYEFIMSLVIGVVAFAFMALFVLALDQSHILSSINALLGSSIAPFTASKLIMLSGVMSLLIFFARVIIRTLWVLISNAALAMMGGVEVMVSDDAGAFTGAEPVAPGQSAVVMHPMNTAHADRLPRSVSSKDGR